ncbi:GAF domain-containing protein [Ancylothrix sp. C2]|uniref:GAF domain-containing protein n=1 Tax=Ancylothrix sp. D3o TaxID=2953691 RepID=UPI0021BAFFDF|nr:GAF domain-containing protein [Ancylothrix sp. D3o]MCT7950642.1 GAF domain-containing protein [Ancylothrix sp. D3o]
MNPPETISREQEEFDLTNCDREPIHLPGTIQPHGIMMVLEEPDLKILQVSNNTAKFLGIPSLDLLNEQLSFLLKDEEINQIKSYVEHENIETVNPIKINVSLDKTKTPFNGIIHRSGGAVILELEPELAIETDNFLSFYHRVRSSTTKLQNATTLQKMCEIAVKEVQQLTGFDRVMVYRFDPDHNGEVIAEAKQENLAPFLGLHYPVSDIPKQARELYTYNALRLIADVNYEAVELIPRYNPLTNQPLDLGNAVLRSVSPLHIEYLQNMGVRASMSISLLKGQKLWGLIACHHQTPKYVSYEIRKACEFIGQVISFEIASKKQNEDYEYQISLKSINAKLIEYMSNEKDYIDGLLKHKPNLLDVVGATGAIIKAGDKWETLGETPQTEQLQGLTKWLHKKLNHNLLYATDCLAKEYKPAEDFKETGSGLIALSFSPTQNSYVIWFRPEVLQTVHWAGNPSKSVEIEEDGTVRLSPRKSFELWKEIVKAKSLPWKECEIDAALELRNAIITIVLRNAEELAKLNAALQQSEAREREKAHQLEVAIQELQRTQTQLIQSEKMSTLGQLVAGIAHEMNNPINFIYGNLSHATTYSQDLIDLLNLYVNNSLAATTQINEKQEEIDLEFILEDLPKLLNSMKVGAERICDIVQSLRVFSRVDESEMKPVNIHDGIESTLMLLSHRLKPKTDYPGIQIIKNYSNLPEVECYPGSLNQVFMNLLTNAIEALEERDRQRTLVEIKENPNQITIRTELINSQAIAHQTENNQRKSDDVPWIRISIADNGPGLPQEIINKALNAIYAATKPEGNNDNLRLAISYQIIVEKHKGNFHYLSRSKQGREFQIEIPLK